MKKESGYTNKYQEILNNCHLINQLENEGYDSFIELFHEEKWPKATCILNHEKLSNHFYIILYGRVKMFQTADNSGKELTLFLLTSGDIFDIFCLLDGYKHNVYYECLDNTKVLSTPMHQIKTWLNNNPSQYKYLLSYAGKQLRLLENYISDITFTDISTRLLRLLVNNVNRDSNNLEVINDLSNKEIANLIGTTRAVVNRHLQKYKNNGSIKISRNHLEVTNLSRLLHLLELQEKNLLK